MTDTFKTESRGALLEGDRYLALLAIVLLGYALTIALRARQNGMAA